MRFLIDTCVVSEWKRRRPAAAVLDWLDAISNDQIAFSILTIGELAKGILRLPPGPRRAELEGWLQELRDVYAPRILPLSFREMEAWARICATAEGEGTPVAAIDGLLAATAHAHGLIVATRNVADFLPTGVPIFDPWAGERHNR
ncbi:MAG: type II toxin-antitoxin system VapC family toxin [Lentisphaerae bacterium]|jgi:toxin FitB|nr:type II toxin-antitoxin system VapC family toxin [Lentisphaerota bacterium]MBT5606706.1 type II toxin-antitoxin system VapC family toxin [Lentisphaerota bacterium]MBT7056991.1 type II toxin-antitoxin system VapC family toxin [Lentisphaerota bacterium]MBT7842078.1 type II toxin-antitoxin system VapC family toxin [Lentisphaerota bacterium]